MFSQWLLCSCFILVFVTVGSQGNRPVESNSASMDHEIYPHHSIIHSLLHKLQGYHPEQDLPQSKKSFLFSPFPCLINWILIRLACHSKKKICLSGVLSNGLFVSLKPWATISGSQNRSLVHRQLNVSRRNGSAVNRSLFQPVEIIICSIPTFGDGHIPVHYPPPCNACFTRVLNKAKALVCISSFRIFVFNLLCHIQAQTAVGYFEYLSLSACANRPNSCPTFSVPLEKS